jgi:CHAT domain-containing protein/tetratricopeptide (TPR) repeat protein
LIALAALLLAGASASTASTRTGCGVAGSDTAALLRQGATWYDQDRYARARACFERALVVAEAATDAPSEAEARRGLGRVLFREGRPDEATGELQRARTLYESLADRRGAARVDQHLGTLALQRGDRARARELYEQARAVFEEIGAPAAGDRAQVLYNLLFVAEGAAERERLVASGLPLAREAKDGVVEGLFLGAWGDMATDAGDYAGAAERYTRARSLFEAAPAPMALGRVLTSLARLQLAHGDASRAITTAREALRVQEGIEDTERIAQTLNLLGTASSRLGRHGDAARYFTRALDQARRRGDARVVKLLSVRLAEARLQTGAARAASALLEEALRPPVDAEVAPGGYELLARAQLAQGRKEAARESAGRALELARAGSKPVFAALQTRALALRALGRWEEALADAQEAVGVVEAMRAKLIPSDFLKQGFGERHQALYGLAIELLQRLGRDAEALETSEQGRARAFLDLLATRESRPELAAPPAPADESVSTAAAPRLADVQAAARRLDSTVLSYWVGPQNTFVWVVEPGGTLHAVRVEVTAARLSALVGKTVAVPDAWRAGGVPDTAAWSELHRLLIAPIAGRLPRQRGALLTVVPHGPLFRLSFAALRDTRGACLLERYALHSVPALAALRFKSAAPAGPPRFLLVADPSALPAAPTAAPLPRLPAARREVEAVRRLLEGQDVTVLAGDAAREAAVREAMAGRSVVHLATHGVVRDDAPMRSFLALGGDAAEPARDGRLTAEEVYGLRLDASLVFLSACRSGRGRVTGDGVLGLTRAFLSAGASSLVTTLWDVPDAAAAALVPGFYRSLQQTGQRARALRAAQLDLLRRLRRQEVKVSAGGAEVVLPDSPVVWAGFVLVGEP